MTMTLQGWHFDDDGSPRNGKAVFYRAASIAEPNPNPILTPTTTTDVSGRWALTVPDGAWDVYLLDGPTVKVWKAGTRLPLSFDDAAIAANAGIELLKLDEGTLDENVNPATVTPVNLQERLSQIVSQMKLMVARPAPFDHWQQMPDTNLHLASVHQGAPDAIHGLPPGARVVGSSMGGVGVHFKWGTGNVGGFLSTGVPTIYYATAGVSFSPPFSTACVYVGVTNISGTAAWAAVGTGAPTASGFTALLASTNATDVGGKAFQWLALGY